MNKLLLPINTYIHTNKFAVSIKGSFEIRSEKRSYENEERPGFWIEALRIEALHDVVVFFFFFFGLIS
jgi:hypothetical protein